MPGGVGAGVPDPTAGKLKEYRGGDVEEVEVAEVEGGVDAIFAFVGIGALLTFGEQAGAKAPLLALFRFFFSRLSRSSQPLAMRWHNLGGHLAASRALSPGAPFGHSRVA